MGIDPQEDPPIKPGQPTEPPQEDPPGNPRPEAAAARCARARWPYLDPDPNPIGAPRDAHNRKAAI
jgi:hypothetical protein